LSEKLNGILRKMSMKRVLEVLILMVAVIGVLGYQYIIPGEMGKSKG
jgi:hypothetical protein